MKKQTKKNMKGEAIHANTHVGCIGYMLSNKDNKTMIDNDPMTLKSFMLIKCKTSFQNSLLTIFQRRQLNISLVTTCKIIYIVYG